MFQAHPRETPLAAYSPEVCKFRFNVVDREYLDQVFNIDFHTSLSYQTKPIPFRGSARVGVVLLIIAAIIFVLASWH